MPPQNPPPPQSTTSSSPELFEPRIWVIKKMARKQVELIPRNVLVDVKMAILHMRSAIALFASNQDAPLNHFDELLERSRRPLPQVIYTIVLVDSVSKKEVTMELSGNKDMDDKEVHDWVQGLNVLEEGMQAEALKKASKE